jgi:hypothetical protein
MKPPYLPNGMDRIAILGGGLVAGGTFRTVTIEFDEWLGSRQERAMNEGKFYVLGYVTYRSSKNGPRYRTAFCRKWDDERLRFYPIKDSDYEYED